MFWGAWFWGRFADRIDPLAEGFPSSQFGIASTFQNDASKWHECLSQYRFHAKSSKLARRGGFCTFVLPLSTIDSWRRSRSPKRGPTHLPLPGNHMREHIGNMQPACLPDLLGSEASYLRRRNYVLLRSRLLSRHFQCVACSNLGVRSCCADPAC